MELKLNNSEVITVLSLLDEEISQDNVDPMIKATIKNILDKINNQVQYKHHNETDEFVCAMINAYYEGN